MALLASCWLLLESFIIPNGFLKWFYLSFYIHPLLLLCCQIFLWFKVLKKWLLLLFIPLAFGFRLGLLVFKRVVVSLFSFVELLRTDEVCFDALGTHIQDVSWEVVWYGSRWDSSCNETSACGVSDGLKEGIDSDRGVGESWLHEYLCSDHYILSGYDADVPESLVLSDQEDGNTLFRLSTMDESVVDFGLSFGGEFIQENNDSDSRMVDDTLVISQKDSLSPAFNCDSNNSVPATDIDFGLSFGEEFIKENEDSDPRMVDDTLVISQEDGLSPTSNCDSNNSVPAADTLLDRESCASNSPLKQQLNHITSSEEDADSFHQKYTSRMRFFNVLYRERLHGMNAILDDQSTSPGSFNSTEAATDTPMQMIWWSRMARKRILRSLECDLETICVAQSCLFWEALHHQHLNVDALAFSENVVFDHAVSVKFQELEILLVRFVEDQKCERHGSSSNILNRLSFQGVLQVPDATGLMIGEEESKRRRGEGVRGRQVVDAIDKCIQAFWLYLKTDNKKLSTWRHETTPVEDPQDLELLYDVSKTLHKKGIMLKNVQGKSKCWLRRKVKAVQTEKEKRDVLFAMIDMNLVQRLLQMSLVSRSHLRWCQQKLNDLDFKQGKVVRGCISHLFPSS